MNQKSEYSVIDDKSAIELELKEVIWDQEGFHIVSLEEPRLHVYYKKAVFSCSLQTSLWFYLICEKKLCFDMTVRELENNFEQW